MAQPNPTVPEFPAPLSVYSRNSNGFAFGQVVVGANVNPCNFVLINQNAESIIEVPFIGLAFSAALQWQIQVQFADPGFAAVTPRCTHQPAGLSSLATAEAAQAAAPGGNVIMAGLGGPTYMNILAGTPPFILGLDQGICLFTPATNATLYVTFAWLETSA